VQFQKEFVNDHLSIVIVHSKPTPHVPFVTPQARISPPRDKIAKNSGYWLPASGFFKQAFELLLFSWRQAMKSENPESTVLDHREIYRGKIVGLHVDTIQQASGRTTIREVVLHPGGVTAVPVLDDGRILLIRQFRYPIGKYILELPAGKLDSGLPPLETIARELEEETGHSARTLTHECTFYTTPGISTESIHFFIARDLVPCAQRLEEGEHITVEAYSLEECLRKIQTGEIADAKTILGIFWYERLAGKGARDSAGGCR
jgi:ADP-ribose pyrophosphatase